jgi:hypothetical protein
VVILAGVVLFVVVVGLYLSIDSLGPGAYLIRVLDGVAATDTRFQLLVIGIGLFYGLDRA